MNKFVVFSDLQIHQLRETFIYQFGEERVYYFDDNISQIKHFYSKLIDNSVGTFGEYKLDHFGIECFKLHQSTNKMEAFLYKETGNLIGFNYSNAPNQSTIIYCVNNSIGANLIEKNINEFFVKEYVCIWEKFLENGYCYIYSPYSLFSSKVYNKFKILLNKYHQDNLIPINFDRIEFKMDRQLPIRKQYFNQDKFSEYLNKNNKIVLDSFFDKIFTFWALRKKIN